MIITPAQMLVAIVPRFPRERFAAGEMYAAFHGRRDLGNTVLRCRETEVEIDINVPEAAFSRMMAVQPGVRLTMASVYWSYDAEMLPLQAPPTAHGHPFAEAIAHVVGRVRSAPDGLREAFDALSVVVSAHFDRATGAERDLMATLDGISYRNPELGHDETVDMLRRIAPDRAALARSLVPIGPLFDGGHPYLAGVGRIEIEVAVGL